MCDGGPDVMVNVLLPHNTPQSTSDDSEDARAARLAVTPCRGCRAQSENQLLCARHLEQLTRALSSSHANVILRTSCHGRQPGDDGVRKHFHNIELRPANRAHPGLRWAFLTRCPRW